MDETPNRRIGRNVRRLRELHNLSQADLAEALTKRGIPGMHPQTITKIEAGNRALKFSEALVLCDVLDVQAEELDEFDEVALLRFHLDQSARAVIKASNDATDAVARFIDFAEGISEELENARMHGVTDPQTLGLARAAAEITVEDIVRRAYAEHAGDVAQHEAIKSARGPFIREKIEEYVAQERRAGDGVDPETP